MARASTSVLVLAFLPAFFPACSPGGGGGSGGGLKVVGSSLAPGQILPINVPIEITFDKPIQENSLSPVSFNFTPLPSSTLGAPVAGPVVGSYFVKPGSSGRTAVFQAACPTNDDNSNGGFMPGNIFGNVEYLLTLAAPSPTHPQVIKAEDGSPLGSSFSMTFRTPSPPQSALLDLVSGPPTVTETAALPATLGLNLLIHPNDAIRVVLNQPVIASSIDNDAVKLTFDDSGTTTRIPATVTLAENCNGNGHGVLTVLPLGVLPAGQTVTFSLAQRVKGFGVGDENFSDVAFHTAIVDGVGGSPQKDVIVEEFGDSGDLDTTAPIFVPFATWGSGLLQASAMFPGTTSSIEIEIGPGTTNGNTASFSTDGGSLKDTNGIPIVFANGVIDCAKFTIFAGTPTNKARLTITGSNPLRIRCSNTFTMQDNTELIASGQKGGTVTGLCTANIDNNNGGIAAAGGGDGGEGSPSTIGSSPRGADGNGPFNTPAGGGKGGRTGYGFVASCGNASPGFQSDRGGGGGGGSFANKTFLSNNTFGRMCYSPAATPCSTASQYAGTGSCDYPLSLCTGGASAPCGGVNPPNATVGEPGGNGPSQSKDALTNTSPARGGIAGTPVFSDGNDKNDFYGRKPDGLSGIQVGELSTVLGGQGGGGGGDGVGTTVFPSPSFIQTDMTAGGGGAGGGIVWIQALNTLIVRGSIRANGGDGGDGEEIWNPPSGNGAGGGGGGSGGMVILESPLQIKIGPAASIQARGGDRGLGSGTIAGAGTPNFCKANDTSSRGGAGGAGLILLGTRFSTSITTSCNPVNAAQAAIETNALVVEATSGGSTTSIACERDATLLSNSKFAPAPHCLVLSYGPKSAARSPWYYTGQASFVGTPTYSYAGINTSSGLVDSSFTETLASGSGGSLLTTSSVALTSSTLAALIASEPKILIGDSFRATSGGTPVTITNASLSGNTVTLTIDTSAASLSSIGSWTIFRNYFVPTVGGAASAFPSTATTATIQFQGADESASVAGSVNSATITAATSDISTLAGKKFLRFLVNFDMNATGGALTTSAPRPGFERIRVPYSF